MADTLDRVVVEARIGGEARCRHGGDHLVEGRVTRRRRRPDQCLEEFERARRQVVSIESSPHPFHRRIGPSRAYRASSRPESRHDLEEGVRSDGG